MRCAGNLCGGSLARITDLKKTRSSDRGGLALLRHGLALEFHSCAPFAHQRYPKWLIEINHEHLAPGRAVCSHDISGPREKGSPIQPTRFVGGSSSFLLNARRTARRLLGYCSLLPGVVTGILCGCALRHGLEGPRPVVHFLTSCNERLLRFSKAAGLPRSTAKVRKRLAKSRPPTLVGFPRQAHLPPQTPWPKGRHWALSGNALMCRQSTGGYQMGYEEQESRYESQARFGGVFWRIILCVARVDPRPSFFGTTAAANRFRGCIATNTTCGLR